MLFLSRDSGLRDKNEVVATALLPLFEKEPEHWEAVTWLNAGDPVPGRDFTAYLRAWHEHVPAKHKGFVARVARELGIEVATASK
ncbi:MAG: hypothetical protein R3F56_26360 [Planctomycetota bacterium]